MRGNQPVIWDQKKIPLFIATHEGAGEKWAFAVRSACDYWNKVLRFRVFMYIGETDLPVDFEPENTAVVVFFPADMDPVDHSDENRENWLGWTRHTIDNKSGYVMRSMIFVRAPLIRPSQIAIHELGHVLGLRHHPDKTDIMHENNGAGQAASQRDIDFIRKLYGRW